MAKEILWNSHQVKWLRELWAQTLRSRAEIPAEKSHMLVTNIKPQERQGWWAACCSLCFLLGHLSLPPRNMGLREFKMGDRHMASRQSELAPILQIGKEKLREGRKAL